MSDPYTYEQGNGLEGPGLRIILDGQGNPTALWFFGIKYEARFSQQDIYRVQVYDPEDDEDLVYDLIYDPDKGKWEIIQPDPYSES